MFALAVKLLIDYDVRVLLILFRLSIGLSLCG